MIKKIALALILVAAAPVYSFAGGSAITALVKEYLKVVPVRETVEDSLSTFINPSGTLAGDQKVAAIIDKMDMKKIETTMAKSLEARFTAAELRAAIAFNKTPEGRAIRKKTLLVSRDVSGVLATEIVESFKASGQKDKGI